MREISALPLEKLLFLDEAGANLSMSCSYARSYRGQRIVQGCPYPRGQKYSLLSTVSIESITAAIYTQGNIDSSVFLHYLEHCLAPKLKAGQYLILDNVAFHKVKGVKQIIESVGAQVMYLPPYSPDLSPIELMWSKIKSTLRKLGARCEDTFQDAIKIAFESVKESDLIGWFKHCGYTQDQLLFKAL